MARKVFISVLGTGNYGECTYKKGIFECRTKFIQQATLEYHKQLGVEWNESDAIYILLTAGARQQNWIECKDYKGNVTDEKGLSKVLAAMELRASIHGVDIKEGKDEAELWDIFDTMLNLIEEDDELYFDLTHGFRYLPMLVLVFGNYVKQLKRATVRAITYGNFEMSKRDTKPAPIIDLLPLSTLQDWAFAAANFKNNGDVKDLLRLSRPELLRRLSESEGKDSVARNLNGFMKQLEKFIDEVRLCRGVDIYNAESFRKMMNFAPNLTDFIKPLKPIIKNIIDTLDDFSTEKGASNCLAAAKWCLSKGLYQQAVTELQEGIVTYFCSRYDIYVDDHSKRGIVNLAFKKKLTPDSYIPSEDKETERKVDEIMKDENITQNLLNSFADLTDIRNDYNHAGMRNDKSYPYRKPRDANKLKAGIKKYIETMIPIFLDILPTNHFGNLIKSHRLFINLSNHPSDKWGEEQMCVAKQYGEIEDLPFPQVSPDASEKDVCNIADEYVYVILGKATDNDVTVHVMGEMGLTFALVKRLQSHGIKCVYSTTERILENIADGSCKKAFNFKQFRDY